MSGDTAGMIFGRFLVEGQMVAHGIGRALNISRAGLLLETPYPIEAELVSLMTVDLEGNLIEIKGVVTYCRRSDFGMYHAGISFSGTDYQISQFTAELIRVHHYQNTSIFLAVA